MATQQATKSQEAAHQLVVVKVSPFNAEAAIPRLVDEVTPNPDFYVRSNFAVPALSAETHKIEIGGAVARPISLDVAELRSLGVKTLSSTLECAGNNRVSLSPLPSGEPWLGGAVSAAAWAGVPLRAVLERAGVKDGVVEILVSGGDNGTPKDGPANIPFARSLPLEKAMHPDTLLALEMNGEPLPPAHGAPVRLLVPGWYGMASVKWVTKIEAITESFEGYYQKKRYIFDYGDGKTPEPVRQMRVKSVIASPVEDEVVTAGTVVMRGRAWSGAGSIAKVEVAIDGGDSWKEARLLGQSGPYLWQAWEFEWKAEELGRHALRSRATDSAGNQQPDLARWNKYGYGSNGASPITVYVR